MEVVRSEQDIRDRVASLRRQGKRIGFVPTMGFLHEGHLSLIRLGRQRADTVVVSIFVNPTQFGPGEDLDRYPRDFERDEGLCRQAGADCIFYPTTDAMYLPDHSVYVEETVLSRGLCGARRPGHFRGVATIVAKLFNIVQPDVAVFGQKDFQQVRVIQQMVRDLNFPVEIVIGPTIREPDGLAMSSRNQYLSPRERQEALCLSQSLELARRLYAQGIRDAGRLESEIRTHLARTPAAQPEYIEIVDRRTLEPVKTWGDRTEVVIALAVRLGKTRLIDNAILGQG